MYRINPARTIKVYQKLCLRIAICFDLLMIVFLEIAARLYKEGFHLSDVYCEMLDTVYPSDVEAALAHSLNTSAQ